MFIAIKILRFYTVFYVLLTVHPCIIFFKWSQLGAHYFLVYLFQLLYMFRATMCPSSEEQRTERAAVRMEQGLMFVIPRAVCFRDRWGNYIRIFDTDFIFLKVPKYWLCVWRRLAVLHGLLKYALSLNWKKAVFCNVQQKASKTPNTAVAVEFSTRTYDNPLSQETHLGRLFI